MLFLCFSFIFYLYIIYYLFYFRYLISVLFYFLLYFIFQFQFNFEFWIFCLRRLSTWNVATGGRRRASKARLFPSEVTGGREDKRTRRRLPSDTQRWRMGLTDRKARVVAWDCRFKPLGVLLQKCCLIKRHIYYLTVFHFPPQTVEKSLLNYVIIWIILLIWLSTCYLRRPQEGAIEHFFGDSGGVTFPGGP